MYHAISTRSSEPCYTSMYMKYYIEARTSYFEYHLSYRPAGTLGSMQPQQYSEHQSVVSCTAAAVQQCHTHIPKIYYYRRRQVSTFTASCNVPYGSDYQYHMYDGCIIQQLIVGGRTAVLVLFFRLVLNIVVFTTRARRKTRIIINCHMLCVL